MKNRSNFKMSENENTLTQPTTSNSRYGDVYFVIGIFCLAIGIAIFLGILYYGIKNF